MTAARKTERPILFAGEMARAILEGRKTQTRRVITGLPESFLKAPAQAVTFCAESGLWKFIAASGGGIERNVQRKGFRMSLKVREYESTTAEERACPYGQPGDTLWVRENYRVFGGEEYEYQKEQLSVIYKTDPPSRDHGDGPFKPSIFMPRWASRLTLEVVSVRAEQLQQCSETDALAEGFPPTPLSENEKRILAGTGDRDLQRKLADGYSSRTNFGFAWDERNAKRGYTWASNPWVWVVEFKRAGDAHV